jgi:hypothetical protein
MSGDFMCDPQKKTPWLESASELYRPTERPPLVGKVSANFNGYRVSRGQRNDSPTVVINYKKSPTPPFLSKEEQRKKKKTKVLTLN